MRAVLVLLLAFVLAAPAVAQDNGEIRKYFKDWLAACRADGYCSATAYVNPNPGGGAVADYILRIGRQAQQTYWEISFTTVATMGDEWSDFVVNVDDASTTFSLQNEVGAYGSVNEFYFLGKKAQEVMDRIMPGKEISVAFTDTEGNAQSASFSLAGLTAALLWIDDNQHRIGSERVAEAPPYGLTPARQDSTPQIPVALLDRARADPECQPFEDLANGRDFAVDTLIEGYALYVVPCWSAAYNFGSKVYLEVNGQFIPQYFASYGGDAMGWTGTPFVVNYSYDPETKTLSEFNKARGVGDCGSAASWTWNGSALRLEEYRYKECDEGPSDENAEMPEFPVVYTAPPAPPVR